MDTENNDNKSSDLNQEQETTIFLDNNLPHLRSERGVIKHGYSLQELTALYDIGRSLILSGELAKAELIANGLGVVGVDFSHGWLLQAYVAMMREDFDRSIFCARQALRVEPKLPEALLILVISYFNLQDFQTGGTYLGEVADLLSTTDLTPDIRKIYETQVIRFQKRIQNKSNKKGIAVG